MCTVYQILIKSMTNTYYFNFNLILCNVVLMMAKLFTRANGFCIYGEKMRIYQFTTFSCSVIVMSDEANWPLKK